MPSLKKQLTIELLTGAQLVYNQIVRQVTQNKDYSFIMEFIQEHEAIAFVGKDSTPVTIHKDGCIGVGAPGASLATFFTENELLKCGVIWDKKKVLSFDIKEQKISSNLCYATEKIYKRTPKITKFLPFFPARVKTAHLTQAIEKVKTILPIIQRLDLPTGNEKIINGIKRESVQPVIAKFENTLGKQIGTLGDEIEYNWNL